MMTSPGSNGEQLQALDEGEQLLLAEVLEQGIGQEARPVGLEDEGIGGRGRLRRVQLVDAVADEVHEPAVEPVVRRRAGAARTRERRRRRARRGVRGGGGGPEERREVHHLDVAPLHLLDLLEYGDGLVREARARQLVGQADEDRDRVLVLARLEEDVGQAEAHARIPAALAEMGFQHLDGLAPRARVGQGDGADGRDLRAARPLDVRGLQHLAHARVRARDRVEGRTVELEELAGAGGDDGRAAGAPGEAGDLAEEVALRERGHLEVAAVGVADEDLHVASRQREEAVPRLPLRHQDVAGLEGVEAEASHDREQLLVGEILEEAGRHQALREVEHARAVPLRRRLGRRLRCRRGRAVQDVLDDVEQVVAKRGVRHGFVGGGRRRIRGGSGRRVQVRRVRPPPPRAEARGSAGPLESGVAGGGGVTFLRAGQGREEAPQRAADPPAHAGLGGLRPAAGSTMVRRMVRHLAQGRLLASARSRRRGWRATPGGSRSSRRLRRRLRDRVRTLDRRGLDGRARPPATSAAGSTSISVRLRLELDRLALHRLALRLVLYRLELLRIHDELLRLVELLDAELRHATPGPGRQLRDSLLLVDEPLEPLRGVGAAGLGAVDAFQDGDGLGHEPVGRELVGQGEQDRDRFLDPARLHQEVRELEPNADRGGQAALELPPQGLDGLAPLALCDQLADVRIERRVEPVQGHRDLGPGATPRTAIAQPRGRRWSAGRRGYVPPGGRSRRPKDARRAGGGNRTERKSEPHT